LSIKFAIRAAAFLALAGLLSPFSSAQQSGQPTSSDSAAQAQPQQPASPSGQAQQPSSDPKSDKDSAKDKSGDKTAPDGPGQGKVAGTSNDRLFYTLPNFLTLESKKQLPPLSVKDKFKVVALGTFDYVQYPWWGLLSAISQADNGEPAYGQGWKAYSKRYGTVAADSTIENFMVGAVFPSVLRQDPRFYQSGQGSFWRRTGYSVSRIFVTRSDSGRTQFNYSEIFGAGTAAAISTYTYHPKSAYVNGNFVASDHTFSNMASTWGTQVSLDALTIVIKEFWPDIHRRIGKKHNAEMAKPQP